MTKSREAMPRPEPLLNLPGLASRLLGLDSPTLEALPPSGPADFAPDALLAEVARVREAARTVEAELLVTLATDAGQTAWVAGRMRHARPEATTLNVTGASDRLAVGSELSWDGGPKVQVKPFGLPFAMAVPVGDSALKDKRGWTFAETSITRLYETLLHPEAVVGALGTAWLGKREVALLEVVSPLRLAPATREVYGIGLDIGVPVHREMWVGDRLIYRLSLGRVRLGLGD